MNGIQYSTLFLSITLCLFSCSEEKKDTGFDYGTIENNVYSNSYFGFEMDIPEGWDVQSLEEKNQLADLGSELLAGDDDEMKATIDASLVNTAYLLSVYKYELGSSVEYNPSFMVLAENTQEQTVDVTAELYLEHATQLLEQSGMDVEVDESMDVTNLGGKDFHSINTVMHYMGLDIQQTYYATITEGFALAMVITYINDDQHKELLDVLETMSF